MGHGRHALALVAALCAALTLPSAAGAADVAVADAASVAAALAAAAPGDTIVLADGVYPLLLVDRRFDPALRIVGGPGARVGTLRLADAAGVEVTGLTLAPAPGSGSATLRVEGSDDVLLRDLVVERGSVVIADASRRVALERSELARCPDGGRCVQVSGGDDVAIVNNLFSGRRAAFAVRVGVSAPLPTRVAVLNNTVLDGTSAGLRLADGYAARPAAEHPTVANNVIAWQPWWYCGTARWQGNLVERGAACGLDDELGAAALDAAGRPTSVSELVVDRALAALAPAADRLGAARSAGGPDRGAYELPGGIPPAPPPAPDPAPASAVPDPSPSPDAAPPAVTPPAPATAPRGLRRDRKRPTVRLVNRTPRARIDLLRLAVTLADDRGVVRVSFAVDGRTVLRGGARPDAAARRGVLLRGLNVGRHTLVVTAWDEAGNAGTALATFSRYRAAPRRALRLVPAW